MKMRLPLYKLIITCLFMAYLSNGQNNLILQLDDGSPFRVFLNDKPYNKSAQSLVEITGLNQDTVLVNAELEKGERFGVTVFLLDKGKKTTGKEFNFVLHREKNRLHPVFMGMRELTAAKK